MFTDRQSNGKNITSLEEATMAPGNIYINNMTVCIWSTHGFRQIHVSNVKTLMNWLLFYIRFSPVFWVSKICIESIQSISALMEAASATWMTLDKFDVVLYLLTEWAQYSTCAPGNFEMKGKVLLSGDAISAKTQQCRSAWGHFTRRTHIDTFGRIHHFLSLTIFPLFANGALWLCVCVFRLRHAIYNYFKSEVVTVLLSWRLGSIRLTENSWEWCC